MFRHRKIFLFAVAILLLTAGRESRGLAGQRRLQIIRDHQIKRGQTYSLRTRPWKIVHNE